ncbi:MAG: type II secretion system protein [Coraliomargarita sp.]
MPTKQKQAFTLIEIMIVVLIIGLLAALAVPALKNASNNARYTRLANDFRIIAGAVDAYSQQEGSYPADSDSGVVPPEIEDYLNPFIWEDEPVIGGLWDLENSGPGYACAFGVVDYTMTEETLLGFDRKYDDGSLVTGVYQKIAPNRYYRIVEAID